MGLLDRLAFWRRKPKNNNQKRLTNGSNNTPKKNNSPSNTAPKKNNRPNNRNKNTRPTNNKRNNAKNNNKQAINNVNTNNNRVWKHPKNTQAPFKVNSRILKKIFEDHDEKYLYYALRLARMAYSSSNSNYVKSTFENAQVVHRMEDDKSDLRGIIVNMPNYSVIILRGTKNKNEIKANLNIRAYQGSHRGINKHANQIMELIDVDLRKKIYITGHSLGGALGVAIGNRLASRADIHVVTFSMPMVVEDRGINAYHAYNGPDLLSVLSMIRRLVPKKLVPYIQKRSGETSHDWSMQFTADDMREYITDVYSSMKNPFKAIQKLFNFFHSNYRLPYKGGTRLFKI